MSYIRFGQERLVGGNSNIYAYPTDWDEDEGARVVLQGATHMTEMDLAELALRMVERADLDDETFAEVVEAVENEFPEFDEPLERGFTDE